ncbi:MAG: hypothetical protein HZB29_12930 [Nitrospinae bacterium]|nr:hypothetical protein [Nitrospinota bacterium]
MRHSTLMRALKYAALAVIALTASCASMESGKSGAAAPEQSVGHSLEGITSVAVMPFYEDRSAKAAGEVRMCRITELTFTAGPVAEGAGDIIGELVRTGLANRGFSIAPRDMTIETFGKVQPQNGGYSSDLAAKTGRAMHMDAVVIGTVMRYEELSGGKMAAEKPASVAFSIAVVHSEDGRILWKAKFDKTQKDLFSDVTDYRTFFRGGMGWKKAGQLAAIGVDDVLELMPLKPGK